MKKTIVLFMVVCLFLGNCTLNRTIGEEIQHMGVIDKFLQGIAIRHFLEKRGILSEDREVYDYADAFLTAALNKDSTAMSELFASNAVSAIGEEQLNQMIEMFIDYFQCDSFTIEVPIGPYTSECREGEKKSKELAGPLEIISDKYEYRLAVKCIACDDWNAGNVGIWSVYIIEKSKDTDLTHPYIGDKEYRTGIYFDINRPD